MRIKPGTGFQVVLGEASLGGQCGQGEALFLQRSGRSST